MTMDVEESSSEDHEMEIEALPTKDLFISMLTKDLTLRDAIGDLVDNSLDGARRIRGDSDYKGLYTKIEIKPEYFSISDNCGGITEELARNYAFRFGRHPNMDPVKHSVGQFGIGMKRALFKLGKEFMVDSTSNNSHFIIEHNVDEWKDKDPWKFRFSKLEREQYSADRQGTIIRVTSLHDNVSEQFGRKNFITELIDEIALEQLYNINMGLEITINDQKLEPPPLKLRDSASLQAAHHREEYKDGLGIHIYAGISEESADDGGWYIFCNKRLILGHEQTAVTGWGTRDSITIPKYHNQYYGFRGYVFIDADDASLLPLNTSKTNMDVDSAKFMATRLKMIQLMRPVIDFLNYLHEEETEFSRGEISEQPLKKTLDTAELVDLSQIPKAEREFAAPKRPPKKRDNMRSIQYRKPKDEIDRAQEALGVNSATEVGKKTFEYFMDMEVDEW